MGDNKIYNPQEFEAKMSELWRKEKTYATSHQSLGTSHSKAYCLSMFPYPSGAGLHVGHVRIYTGTDVLARYFRMSGKDVLHPMGWDAFGLPAENAAIKAKKNPMDMVPGNIATFKRQMNMLGLSYDWNRELATTDPAYYKWTQWLFIQFFKMGLLYKKNTPINFCPKCKTGLAEEEVLANGTHERCGTAITKKELPQWIFRITAYADRLLEDLKLLDWPKGILEMQRNWIGRSEGMKFKEKVKDMDIEFEVFDTVPQTFMAQTFTVIAPEHPLVEKLVKGTKYEKEVMAFVQKIKDKKIAKKFDADKEIEGIFTGRYVDNPFGTGDLELWVASYAIYDYGTGIVNCSAHDLRDFAFAKKYNIPLKTVMLPKDEKLAEKVRNFEVVYHHEEEGIIQEPAEFKGMTWKEALKPIIAHIEKKGFGKMGVHYHLRDWIFSRQRYWGEPIPMVHCENCEKKGMSQYNEKFEIPDEVKNANKGWIPLDEDQLPFELPYTKSYEPTDTGESPLSAIEGFADTTCPVCGGKATRETDTMPNWAGSCWYFIRFASSATDSVTARGNSSVRDTYRGMREEWMATMAHSPWAPVDWYLGGAEHAVLHLLYARFWVKALQDLGLLDYPEPFLRLRNVGMVLAEDHRKMSKSWGNTINPDDVVAQYGADTLRMYEMFMAPFNMEIAWSTAALQGGHRFLKRVWSLYNSQLSTNSKQVKSNPELVDKLNKTIKKVGEDIAQTKFNTAIAAMMEFLNAFEAHPELSTEEAKKFIQIIAPFAPFTTEKIWRDVFHEKTSVHISNWPAQTAVSIKDTVVKLPIQIQGKFRGVVLLAADALEEKQIEEAVLKDEGLAKHIAGRKYRLIYVKGKICNFVLN